MDKRFLTVRDLCEVLQVHRSTIYEWRKEGRLPEPVKAWGSPRFDREEVERALREKNSVGIRRI